MSGNQYFNKKSPFYFVRKRLLSDVLALCSLLIIAITIVIALAGYLILPDGTSNANDGAVEIAKLPPGSSVTILKIRKNTDHIYQGGIDIFLNGRQRNYIIVPVDSYEIDGLTIKVDPYGMIGGEKDINLVNATLAIGQPEVDDREIYSESKYKFDGNIISYPDMDGNIKKVSYDQLLSKFKNKNLEERTYWLGTDRSGRDLLSRLLLGARVSLSIGFMAVCISLVLGIIFGSIAGYFGGKIDDIIMWLISVVWAIPAVMLVIAVSMALQSRGLWVAFLAVGLTMWVEVARVVRGQMMALKEKLFVEAARAYGLNNFSIVFKHIMPNMIGPLLVIATANFAAAIMLEAGLSFLGLGVQPPAPSWGMMVYEGFQVMGSKNSWHMILFPGLAICILVLCFNIIGNSLHDAIDPRNSENG